MGVVRAHAQTTKKSNETICKNRILKFVWKTNTKNQMKEADGDDIKHFL